MKVLAGTKSKSFVDKIVTDNDKELVNTEVTYFNDNEMFVRILDNVRKSDVYVVQSLSNPANDSIMELLMTMDALTRSSVENINVVIPYFGYARQDRKTESRTPISAKLVANLITSAGADRLCTMDLHKGQIQGFFDIPVDNLVPSPLFLDDIKNNYDNFEDIVMVSPDVGGIEKIRNYATKLNTNIAIIDKRRPKAGESEVMNVIGEVKGKHCIIVDDIVDTAGTLCRAAKTLLENGALSVRAYITHGVLSVDKNKGISALSKIENSHLDELVITNTIDQNGVNSDKLRVIDASTIFKQAMDHISSGASISKLFT